MSAPLFYYPYVANFEMTCSVRVVLKGTGVPTEIEIRSLPKHKKNLAVGNKDIIYSSEIYLEASEVATFALNEEVGLSSVRFFSRDDPK